MAFLQAGQAGTLQWDQANPSCILLDSYFEMGARDTAAEEIWLIYEYCDIIHETKWTKPIAWDQTNPMGCFVFGVYYAYSTYGLPFEAESRTANGVWDYICTYANVVETLNPSGQIVVDNSPNNSVITKPIEDSVSITVRYAATDPDGDLRGIRPQKWNASTNELETNGGVFETASGYSSEIVQTYTITDAGDYYFWMDIRDSRLQANNTHVGTAAWQSGYHITIKNENRAPEIVLDTVSHTDSGTVCGNGWAADPDDGAPVSRVEIWLDGVYKTNASLGGDRADVALYYDRSDYQYSGYAFSLTASGLQPGQHELLAKAFDTEGGSNESCKSFTVLPSVLPPQNLIATPLSSYSVRLEWNAVSGTGLIYELQRRDTASGYQQVAILGGGATGHVDSGLAALSTYAYRIRTVTSANLISVFSSEAVTTTLDSSQDPSDFINWALSYGLDPNQPGNDADGDGISNYDEYLVDSNPLSSDSCFHLILARPDGSHLGVNIGNWDISSAKNR